MLELPRGLTPTELAGGFGFPDARPLALCFEYLGTDLIKEEFDIVQPSAPSWRVIDALFENR